MARDYKIQGPSQSKYRWPQSNYTEFWDVGKELDVDRYRYPLSTMEADAIMGSNDNEVVRYAHELKSRNKLDNMSALKDALDYYGASVEDVAPRKISGNLVDERASKALGRKVGVGEIKAAERDEKFAEFVGEKQGGPVAKRSQAGEEKNRALGDIAERLQKKHGYGSEESKRIARQIYDAQQRGEKVNVEPPGARVRRGGGDIVSGDLLPDIDEQAVMESSRVLDLGSPAQMAPYLGQQGVILGNVINKSTIARVFGSMRQMLGVQESVAAETQAAQEAQMAAQSGDQSKPGQPGAMAQDQAKNTVQIQDPNQASPGLSEESAKWNLFDVYENRQVPMTYDERVVANMSKYGISQKAAETLAKLGNRDAKKESPETLDGLRVKYDDEVAKEREKLTRMNRRAYRDRYGTMSVDEVIDRNPYFKALGRSVMTQTIAELEAGKPVPTPWSEGNYRLRGGGAVRNAEDWDRYVQENGIVSQKWIEDEKSPKGGFWIRSYRESGDEAIRKAEARASIEYDLRRALKAKTPEEAADEIRKFIVDRYSKMVPGEGALMKIAQRKAENPEENFMYPSARDRLQVVMDSASEMKRALEESGLGPIPINIDEVVRGMAGFERQNMVSGFSPMDETEQRFLDEGYSPEEILQVRGR